MLHRAHSRTRPERVTTGFEMYPRLPLREAVIILLIVAAGVTVLIVNAKRSHPELHGPIDARLKQSGGVYSLSFPLRTPMSRAWKEVLRPFPPDTKISATYDAAGCEAVIVHSEALGRKLYPGLVDIEFQTTPKNGGYAVFDAKNVNTVVVSLLVNERQQPSC
jgi:hypothetical protein